MSQRFGEAPEVVTSAYRALDLFAGEESALLKWSKGLNALKPIEDLLPSNFTPDSKGVLVSMLTRASVILDDGTIDAYRLQGFQQIVELLPHFRAEESKRQPEPRPQIVFTVPSEVELPTEARHLQRSLLTRVYDALVTADRRVLLLSPYWSDEGRDALMPALERALSLDLPVTLAGAKRDSNTDHHDAMLRFGQELLRRGADVRVLTFLPPKHYSILHAKVVAGKHGYLGSANLTGSGLGEHVEAGLPLGEPDVEQMWWLLEVLERAELLQEEHV